MQIVVQGKQDTIRLQQQTIEQISQQIVALAIDKFVGNYKQEANGRFHVSVNLLMCFTSKF
jgi:hypothetical protein